MKLSQLSSGQLSALANLIEEKEVLQAKLSAIEAKLDNFTSGAISSAPRLGRPPGRPKGAGKALADVVKAAAKPKTGLKRGPKKGEKPGRLKETILAALQAIGAGGATIPDLSEKIQVKSNNLYSWFYTTGKKIAGLKKDGSKYIYETPASTSSTAAS